ncbi:MAG: hypothetical protein Q4P11_03215 [Methanobrevibacter sp.]|nr:hypothetical protein [Methanobrevibacter sp.]
MEDKKAKFIVYIVIALIAFTCSTAVYSMTGGLSDWIVTSMNTNEDLNNNGYLDSSEGGGFFSFNSNDDNYNSYDDSYNYDNNGEPGIIDKIYNKLFNSDSNYGSSYYSGSSYDDNPDFLARLLRFFISDG